MKVHNQNDPGGNPSYEFSEDTKPCNSDAEVNMTSLKKGGSSKLDCIVNDPGHGPSRLRKGK